MEAPSQIRSRLWTRDFTLIWGMTFLTFFASFQLFPTVPLRLREFGATLAESSRFMTLFTLGSAVGALFTGPLGDRIGHRRLLLLGASGFAACLFLEGIFTTRWGFYLLAFPHGVVWSGVLTGTMSTLGAVLPPERRTDGLALYGLASPGGAAFGPALGLWMNDHAGFRAMMWTLTGLFLVLAALSRGLPTNTDRAADHAAFRLPERQVFAPCAVLFLTALGYGALGTYTAQEARALDLRFLGHAAPSAFLSTMALGMVVMRLLVARTGFGRRPARLMPWMLALALAGFSALAFWPGGISRHIFSAALYGAGYSMVHTLVNSYLLETVDPQRRGAAFGALLFAFDSGIGLGALTLGWVIGHHSYAHGWALGALFLALALPVGRRMARKAA